MRPLFAVVVTALALAFATPSSARAWGTFGGDVDHAPSVFSYGFRGLMVGTLSGFSGGYLVARHDGFEGDDWRPLVLGMGIGALTGAGVGLTLGFVDLADDRPGMGAIALRDTYYGALFGSVVGAITGALVVIRTSDPEHILFGASIGTLAGVGVGLGIGLIEGSRMRDSPAHRYGQGRAPRIALTAVRDVSDQLVWTPSLSGRF